ncbi:ATP-binding protein [Cellulomonas carbonis]|nr:ATP-binding protein [Cellulomonas carbonis]
MLNATGDAIRRGRAFAVQTAQELGAHPDTLPVVELLASELVTNAVKFGGDGGQVALSVSAAEGLLRIEVSDDSTTPPRVDDDRPAHLGGHGMKLVELLATDWGVVRTGPTDGKTVWMTMPLHRSLSAARDASAAS